MRTILIYLFLAFVTFPQSLLEAQGWSALGIGLDDNCRALTVDANGNVYAGGDFKKALTSFGDVKDVNYIARWNGSEWLTLGKGVDGPVYAVAMDRNNRFLYVGGEFEHAYQSNGTFISTPNVARWDKLTGNWSALGPGFDGPCTTLYIDKNNTVYAGGNFDKSGTVTVNNIATWDGSSWLPIGSGLVGKCDAIIKDEQGNLFVGGALTAAGGIAVTGVAKWNGSLWMDFAPGISGATQEVFALTLNSGGDLYAGGWFNGAGAINSPNILRWDGNQWNGVGDGLSNAVYDLALDSSDNVFAAGNFEEVQGGLLELKYAAYWNGNWNAMNGGLDDWCGAIAIAPDGSVFLGGGFQIAGNIEAKHIARWTPAWVGREQLKEGEVRLRIHPQPASDELYIETASLFRPGEEITLSVYASDGQLLLSEEDIAGKRQHLNISRLHPGIYILQLTGSLRSVMQIIMKE